MLCCLLLKELTVPAFGGDLDRVILSCGLVESMSECFTDDRTPWWVWYTYALWMSRSNWMPSSLDTHFIIMPLAPHRNKISSTRWYYLDLCIICTTLGLSSDGGLYFRNILIGCFQSYACSCSGSSITIRFCLIVSLVDSADLTEG
jgi:hypothetical protein